MNILSLLDLVGTGVFAISGALTAYDKKLDLFGISAVAFITALGGGTLRDILIGSTPVAWMTNTVYLLVIFIGILFALAFRTYVMRLRKTLFLFDTIGIAVFTVLGLQKSLNVGIDPIIAIMMGMVSAVFGGVIRDIVCNEIPLIFQKEIYALVCIAGGALYVILLSLHFDDNLVLVISTAFIIVFRILSVIKKWHLPTIY
ncbi:MAG: putative membrane protein YeiH [Cyclobacteriaceae bacterium]|jgi:uncharacterized membrane protein YeiH